MCAIHLQSYSASRNTSRLPLQKECYDACFTELSMPAGLNWNHASASSTSVPNHAREAYSAAAVRSFFNGGLRKIDTETCQAIIISQPAIHQDETSEAYGPSRGSDWIRPSTIVVLSDMALLLTRGESGEKQFVAAAKENPFVYAPRAD